MYPLIIKLKRGRFAIISEPGKTAGVFKTRKEATENIPAKTFLQKEKAKAMRIFKKQTPQKVKEYQTAIQNNPIAIDTHNRIKEANYLRRIIATILAAIFFYFLIKVL